MLMRYLAFMGGTTITVEEAWNNKCWESNPVLEAFENAKTLKNNNSSSNISSRKITSLSFSDPERNCHCFYMLCAALPEDVIRFKVGDPRNLHYLNQSNCYEVANTNDAREYLDTRNAMDVLGINQDAQDTVFRVVASVLHLGNINFIKGKEPDSSQLKDDKALHHLKMLLNY